MARWLGQRREPTFDGEALLGVEDRVVLELGVGAETGLQALGLPSLRPHEVRELVVVRNEHRLQGVEPGVVDGAGPIVGPPCGDESPHGVEL